jgi:hypothetical protein
MPQKFAPREVLESQRRRRFSVKQERFPEEKTAGILREAETRETPIADLCR